MMKTEQIFEAIKKKGDSENESIIGLLVHDFSNLEADLMEDYKDDTDVNSQDEAGKTLLHYAVERGLTKTVSRLLSKGANTEIVDNEGNTPLLGLMWGSDEYTIRQLINAGANPLKVDKRGFNCFLLSASLGKKERISFFISSLKMDVNQKHPISGETALHRAVFENRPEIIKLLLSHAADKELTDKKGNTPLERANKLRYKNICQILSEERQINQKSSSQATDNRLSMKKYSSSRLLMLSAKGDDSIPLDLANALKAGKVQDYIDKKHTTLSELITLQQEKPWVITALRYSNIRTGVYESHITIDQLCRLSEEQIHSLESKYYKEELAAKIEEYLPSSLSHTG